MPQMQQLFRDADRQQVIADTLAQKAMAPRPQYQGGRITPKRGWGEGLAQLGEAWMARRANKKAQSAYEGAESERQRAQAAALRRMAGMQDPNEMGPPEPANPYASAQEAMSAGVDPGIVDAYMQQQVPSGSGDGSASIQGYQLAKAQGYEGTYLDYKREFEGRQANTPSSVLEWNVFNALSPQEQQSYLEMKRNVQITDVNSVPTRVLGGGGMQPLSTVESEADAAGTIRGAETRASEDQRIRAEATADLPRVEQNATQAMSAIDQLLEHPGFSGIFGKSGILQGHRIPGTAWADANALLNQVKGKTFLEAFQTLKGGGQITELEGTKAEQAIARLDRAQSDEAARQALMELREIAQIGVERARARAGVGAQQGQVPQQSQGNEVDWGSL